MTGTNHDPDVDQLLRSNGAEWRASLPPTPDPYATLEKRATGRRSVGVGALLAAFASIAAIVVIGVFVVVSLPSRDQGFAAATATPATQAATAPSVTPTANEADVSPTATPRAEASENPGEAACSAILDNIPLVRVNSGKPTLGGAFEVTGAQLTSYFVATLDADPNQSNGSDWWGQPTKLVDLCLYDGDFTTMTPGPPEANRSAVRVLVVISDGDAEFWASTLNKGAIPAADPATAITPAPTQGALPAADAIAAVVAFVDNPTLTNDLAAEGPNEGAAGSWYDVTGANLAATVDADSGAVTSLLFLGSQSSGGKGPTSDEAIAIAEAFLTAHGLSYDGMTRTVEKMDHGETWEWVVKWARYAGDVLLPDSIDVGVNPAGEVWRWASFRRPYGSPPAARIDQATAEEAAIAAAFPDAPQTKIESAQLRLKVDADGNQRLVWDVQVTGWVAMGSGPAVPMSHAWVEVDAETGAATVVGVG